VNDAGGRWRTWGRYAGWRAARATVAAPVTHSDTHACDRRTRMLLVAAALLGVMLPLTAHLPSFWRTGFCAPAAAWAAAILQAPWEATDQGYLIALPALSIHVTRACSAAQFFCLLWSLMAAVGIAGGAGRGWRIFVRMGLPRLAGYGLLAYVLTLLANTARVLLGWWAGLWARYVLPESFHAGVHLAVGLCVFTLFLMIGYIMALRLSNRPETPCGPAMNGPVSA
jgi:hypothetical protein